MPVIAVCEWESSQSTSPERIKVRLDPGTITQLKQALRPVLDDVSSFDECSTIELFDPQTSSYTPAFPDLQTLDENMLIQRFTKIWRVRVESSRHAEESTLLALPSRAYSQEQGYAIHDGGGILHLVEKHNQRDSTAFTVWDGGLLLADYLQSCPELVRGKTILELGAGVGLVGLVTAALGANYVLLTDLPHVLGVLRENVTANESLWREAGCQDVQCAALSWFEPHPLPKPSTATSHWDVIILADCVWTLDLVAPLLSTLKALLDQRTTEGEQESLKLLISYQRRGHHAHEAFWQGLSEIFSIEEVDTTHHSIPLPNPKLLLRKCTPKYRAI